MNSKRSVLQLCASLSHDICRSLPLPITQEMSTGQFKLFSFFNKHAFWSKHSACGNAAFGKGC